MVREKKNGSGLQDRRVWHPDLALVQARNSSALAHSNSAPNDIWTMYRIATCVVSSGQSKRDEKYPDWASNYMIQGPSSTHDAEHELNVYRKICSWCHLSKFGLILPEMACMWILSQSRQNCIISQRKNIWTFYHQL